MNDVTNRPRTLIDALTAAARRGVKVELLLPEDSDVPLVDWAACASFAAAVWKASLRRTVGARPANKAP